MAMARVIGVSVLAAAALGMPGCIVQDIHDQLKRTNEQLESRLAMLDTTNDELVKIRGSLEKTNEILEGVKAELATTNETMGKVQKRLEVLDPINTSLTSLDSSLKTVKNLIEKIPFVGASDEKDEKKPEDKPGENKPGEAKPVAPEGGK